MKCPKCGFENKENALYCAKCGENIVEITTTSEVAKKAEEKIELELPKNIDVEMAKVEKELDEEEDLQTLLTSSTTNATQTMGNAQAQTVIHQDISEKPEVKEDNGPTLVMAPTKTEELIAQKKKEKAERDARIAEREAELQKELKLKEQAKPKQQERVKGNSDDKLFGLISYFTMIGWVIIYFMKGNNRSEYLTRRLNETLIIYLMSVGSFLPLIGPLLSLASIVLWVMGLYNVITNKDGKLPVIGDIELIK